MERPELSFEELSEKYGEKVARYMRAVIERVRSQHAQIEELAGKQETGDQAPENGDVIRTGIAKSKP